MRRDHVLQFVLEAAQTPDFQGVTAQAVADALSIWRNDAAVELNKLVAEGKLRRVGKKNVRFFPASEETADIRPEPAVQEELPDVPVSVNESAPQFIRPVNGVLLRGFSAEALSYDRTMADWRVHRGWDIACAAGEPVLAVSDGTVTAVYEDDLLGTVVEIDHGNDVVSVYANLDVSPAVGVGQTVACGDTVGAVGSTALAESGEEAHLHFAMRRGGSTVDPAEYVPET